MQAFLLAFLVLQIGPGKSDVDRFDRAAIGVAVTDIPSADSELGKTLKLPTHKGVMVVFAWKDGPADKARIGALDIITAINGKKVETFADYMKVAHDMPAGPVPCSVYRYVNVKGNVAWRKIAARPVAVKYRDIIDSQITKKVDEATGLVTYSHRDTPEYVNTKSSIDAYIDEAGGTRKFNLRITYVAKEWVFIQSYIFGVENQRFTLPTKFGEVERDNTTKIWEWYDASANPSDDKAVLMKLSRALATMRPAKLFYIGRSRRDEREISPEEQARILLMLEYLDAHPAGK